MKPWIKLQSLLHLQVKHEKPAKMTEKLRWEKEWEGENVTKARKKSISRIREWSFGFIGPTS